MDNSVRHSADCLDYRLQRVSRCGWIDPLAADLCCNLFDFAFRNGSKRSLTQAPKCPWLERMVVTATTVTAIRSFEAIPPEPLCLLPKPFHSGANCKYRIQLHAYSHISSFPFGTILLIGNPSGPGELLFAARMGGTAAKLDSPAAFISDFRLQRRYAESRLRVGRCCRYSS